MRSLFSCGQHGETAPRREKRRVYPCGNPGLKPTMRRIVDRLPSYPLYSNQDLYQASAYLYTALQGEFGGMWFTMIGQTSTRNVAFLNPTAERLPNGNENACEMIHRGHYAYAAKQKVESNGCVSRSKSNSVLSHKTKDMAHTVVEDP